MPTQLSEFYGSARQSRVSLLAEGKTSWGTLRGYYEADCLGTGITSNNNQSNSYVLRQRVLYAAGRDQQPLDVRRRPVVVPGYGRQKGHLQRSRATS